MPTAKKRITDTAKEIAKDDPMEYVLAIMQDAVDSWKDQNSPEYITQSVHTLLNKSKEKIVMKLMGFDAKFDGRWELDHCNGRSGESSAGDYFKKVASEAIKDWMNRIDLSSLKVPPSINKAMKEAYEQELRYSFIEIARSKARQDLKNLLDSFARSPAFEAYEKIGELLKADNSI